MKELKYVDGNLITLAQEGAFDVIAHGCNCFCRMKRGIAPQMVKAFETDNKGRYSLENPRRCEGDMDKLGRIQGWFNNVGDTRVRVYNMYTQYHWRENAVGGNQVLDYDALSLCLKKLAHDNPDAHIGLPRIGCGLAGGDWELVEHLINLYLLPYVKQVTIVNYNESI